MTPYIRLDSIRWSGKTAPALERTELEISLYRSPNDIARLNGNVLVLRLWDVPGRQGEKWKPWKLADDSTSLWKPRGYESPMDI